MGFVFCFIVRNSSSFVLSIEIGGFCFLFLVLLFQLKKKGSFCFSRLSSSSRRGSLSSSRSRGGSSTPRQTRPWFFRWRIRRQSARPAAVLSSRRRARRAERPASGHGRKRRRRVDDGRRVDRRQPKVAYEDAVNGAQWLDDNNVFTVYSSRFSFFWRLTSAPKDSS